MQLRSGRLLVSGWFPRISLFKGPYCTWVDAGHATDEGSEEQLKKKLKALEDWIEKMTRTNAALTDTVRALQKEKADTCHHADDQEIMTEEDTDLDDSPMLFAAWKVPILSSLSHVHVPGWPPRTDRGHQLVKPRCSTTEKVPIARW